MPIHYWSFLGLVLTSLTSPFSHATEPRPSLEIRLHHASGFESDECRAKLDQALALIEDVLSSTEFREEVLNYTWQSKYQFAQADGLTNEQVYEKIMNGIETLNSSADPEIGTVDLELALYRPLYRWSKVIGFTRPNQKTIYINQYRLQKNSPEEVAANIVHEWTHKLGFDHDHRNTPQRAHSVPYAVGNIFHAIASKNDEKQANSDSLNL